MRVIRNLAAGILGLFVREVRGRPPATTGLTLGLWVWDAPWWMRLAYKVNGRMAGVFAVAGLHLVLRAWSRRYELYELLCTLGLWDVEEGAHYDTGRWTWRYWHTLQRRAFNAGVRAGRGIDRGAAQLAYIEGLRDAGHAYRAVITDVRAQVEALRVELLEAGRQKAE